MDEQDAAEPLSPGAALVRKRWDKTTKAERVAVARMLVAARRAKAAGKVRSKRGKKSRRKSNPVNG